MIEPKILFENANYLVLNKPSGWYSIPARVPKPDDLVLTDWMKSTMKLEPWVVHRLDRFTTGVILFARTREAHAEGNHWFGSRQVKKTYHFLAAPHEESPILSKPALQIKTPIDGKPSQTLFEVIKRGEKIFYGKATPLTGRFHQIREHAKEGGFPLLGDKTYGFDPLASGITFPRVALHAFELTLPFATVQAPIPEDMNEVISMLNSSRGATA